MIKSFCLLVADGFVDGKIITRYFRLTRDSGRCTDICRRECDSPWSFSGDVCICAPCPDYGGPRKDYYPNPKNESCSAVCPRENCYDEAINIWWKKSCYCSGCPQPRDTLPEDHLTCKKSYRVISCWNSSEIPCWEYVVIGRCFGERHIYLSFI